MSTKILMIILDIFGIILAITGIWLSRKMKQKRAAEKSEMQKATYSKRDNSEPKPGSDAHYAAWREEQLKKNGKDD